MSNYNKVFLMGRLTRDPELRYTPQGTAVVDIGLATNREYTVGTEKRKETTFVDITFWARQAEVICQYLKKGAPLFVEGRLSLDTWESDGQKRSKLRIVADTFQFIGSRQGGDATSEGDSTAGDEASDRPRRSGVPSASPRYQETYSRVPPAAVEGAEAAPEGPLGVDENDIPF